MKVRRKNVISSRLSPGITKAGGGLTNALPSPHAPAEVSASFAEPRSVPAQPHTATLSFAVNLQRHYFKCPVAQTTKFVCGPGQTTNLATHSENQASKTSNSAEGILSSRAIDPR